MCFGSRCWSVCCGMAQVCRVSARFWVSRLSRVSFLCLSEPWAWGRIAVWWMYCMNAAGVYEKVSLQSFDIFKFYSHWGLAINNSNLAAQRYLQAITFKVVQCQIQMNLNILGLFLQETFLWFDYFLKILLLFTYINKTLKTGYLHLSGFLMFG